jgi:hypothetical protein
VSQRAVSSEPRWVGLVLAWRGTGLLAQLALVSAYLLGGALLANGQPQPTVETGDRHKAPRPSAFWRRGMFKSLEARR